MTHRLRRILPLSLYAVWILFALYPNPMMLFRSIPNSLEPRIDPAAVSEWAKKLPDDPKLIEERVLGELVPYAVPWQTHGVPWYFPTTQEVVERGSGDCQARMLVLASILEAKGIPYKLRASFDHIWVEYPKKRPNALENGAIAIMRDDGQGRKMQLPEKWDWRETYRIEREYFWDYMPGDRKLVLLAGLAAIFLTRRNLRGGMPTVRRGALVPSPAYARVEDARAYRRIT